ncbi:MAG: ABC transporter permease [Elusimicrobiales bacterium]
MREGWLFLRLALREISGDKGFALSFALTLAVGLTGLFALEMLKASFEAALAGRSRAALGADVLVNSRRQLSEGELAAAAGLLPAGSELRREVSLLSMALAPAGARLVELRAVDGAFPFYGEAGLRGRGRVAGADSKDIVSSPSVWVAPELATQLGAVPGSRLKIGDVLYTVTDIIDDDPASAAMGLNLAPRVYAGLATLPATNLLSAGSRVAYRYLYRLPPGADADAAARAVSAGLRAAGIRASSHRDALESLTRGALYVGDYLGLVALSGLFLSAVGCVYLAHSFLTSRMKAAAVLVSLGASHATAFLSYLSQFLLLSLAAAALAGLAALGLVQAAAAWAGPMLGADLRVSVSPHDAAAAMAAAAGAVALFCGPLLLRLRRAEPASLLRGGGEAAQALSRLELAAYLPAAAAFWLMAVWQAQSWRTGGLFAAVFLLSAAAAAGAGAWGLGLLGRLRARALPFAPRMALRSLARRRTAALAGFLAVSLGVFLVALIPALRATLDSQLETGETAGLPGLFMFDIQEEQEPLLRRLLAEAGAPANFVSPMIRGRITAVNGEPFVMRARPARRGLGRDDDEEGDWRGRGRARIYNLSYRAGLSSAESVVEGRHFTGPWSGAGLPEVSLERRFAWRLGGRGVKPGDTVTFDIQGVVITARVAGLRSVRWTSFQPNFFIQFQPGVLEDAPKTYVAAAGRLPRGERDALQRALAEKFPNVSVVDVEATVRRGLELTRQISAALSAMAWTTLLAGLAVLFAIARHQAAGLVAGMALMKVLGARPSDVAVMAALEFALLGLAAAAAGAGLSFAGSALLAHFVFDTALVFSPWPPLLITLAAGLLCGAMGLLAGRRALAARPVSLLKAD